METLKKCYVLQKFGAFDFILFQDEKNPCRFQNHPMLDQITGNLYVISLAALE